MKLSLFDSSYTQEAVELFTEVFTVSEDKAEGRLIGNLVINLITTTTPEDLVGFVATTQSRLVGCIFFSRFVTTSNKVVFILSPVAIAINQQGSGIGQKLIIYGLNYLKSRNVNWVLTYGDPNYYSKTGFKQISEKIIQAPFELSQPEGWLGQSLDGTSIDPVQGLSHCVEALSDQKYW